MGSAPLFPVVPGCDRVIRGAVTRYTAQIAGDTMITSGFRRGSPLRGVAALTAAVCSLVVASACAGNSPPGHPAGTSSPPLATTSGATASPAPAAPAPSPAPVRLSYQPLFPFADLADAHAWQASYAFGGHQPWHLSAGMTALAFTRGYLGFRGIDRVVRQTRAGGDARVTVGFLLPNGNASSAATIHLITYGSGRYAPWEVVGTDDTTLTLDTPAYGSAVSSPLTAGGKITGVDENLQADVHQLGSASPVGSYCCRPAGGQASPWSVPVAFHATTGQVITIVVHTGGHIAAVERFAVTGARVR